MANEKRPLTNGSSNFHQQAERLRLGLEKLVARVGDPAATRGAADRLAQDVAAAVAELRIAGEKLQQRNDELLAGAAQFEAERQCDAALIEQGAAERHPAENRLARLARLYSVLSRVNETIVRTRDEPTLFQDVCRIIADDGAFPLVWIGEVRDRAVAPSACCGPASDYLDDIEIEIDGVLGQGPTGTCIRENRPVINDDFAANPSTAPWREAALRRGFRASAAIPLRRRDQPVGALTLYAAEAGAFDAEQVQLLEALGADISYALDALDDERLRLRSEDRLTDLLAAYERRTAETEALIDALPHAVYFGNENGISRCNDLALRMLGASSLRDLQARIGELGEKFHVRYRLDGGPVEPENLPFTRALNGEAAQLDTWATQADTGRDVLIRGNAAPVVVGGRTIGAVAVNIDITDQYRAQQALREIAGTLEQRVAERTAQLQESERLVRESEERYRTLVEASPDFIAIVADGRYVYVSPGAVKILGAAAAEDLLGRSPLDFVHPDDRELAAAQGRRLAEGVPEARAEHRVQRLDGRAIDVESRARPIVYRGKPAVLSLLFDVTDRKRATELLRDQAELLELAHDAIFVREPGGRIVFWNHGAEATYGWTREEARGRISHELLQTQFPVPLAEIDAIIAAHGFWNGELLHATKDGRTLAIATRWASKKNDRGEITAILEINRDISLRKKNEERLGELNVALQQRAEQLRALAAELTQAEDRERRRLAQILHDHLQQLLAGATLSVASVKLSAKDPQTAQGLELVEKLLRQSIDASRSLTAELAPPILYDGGLADALHWLARWMKANHHLDVEVHAEDDVEVATDARLLLFQAARELLFNVKKHAGVDQAKIYLGAWGSDRLKLSVADRGAGFDADRTGNKEKIAGGFGLFSIRERLEWIGGRIEIASVPGHGARVTLFAPRFVKPAAAAPEPAADGAPAVAEAARRPGSPIRVLVADDHRIVRQGVVKLLRESADIVVVGEAENGRQAVDLTRRLAPDVVVMDITMPEMNGIDATRLIMSERPRTRVIGLSMHAAGDMKKAMVEAGAVTYLPKDGPAETLVAAIRGAAPEDAKSDA